MHAVKLGIIGTGNMGGGLGRLWARKAHEVFFGSRDPKKAQALAASIGGRVRGGGIREAAAFGDAVLLATPWEGVRDALKAVIDRLAIKGEDQPLCVIASILSRLAFRARPLGQESNDMTSEEVEAVARSARGSSADFSSGA